MGSRQVRREWIRRGLEILLICAALLSPLLSHAAEIDTVYVGINLHLEGLEIYGDFLPTWPSQAVSAGVSVSSKAAGVSLSEDLHQRVKDQRLSPGEALQIESELMMRQGSVYYLPQSQDELKDAVGFPKEMPLSPTDLRELVPVHTQMSLGISPMTAAYLVEKMNMKIVVSTAEAASLQTAAPAATANPTSGAQPVAPSAASAAAQPSASVAPANSPSVAPSPGAQPVTPPEPSAAPLALPPGQAPSEPGRRSGAPASGFDGPPAPLTADASIPQTGSR